MILLSWFAIFIHECGHVLGALVSGMRIYTVTVKKWQIYSRSPHIVSPHPFGGYVLALKQNPRLGDLLVQTLGGPLLSIVAALGMFWLCLLNRSFSPLFSTGHHVTDEFLNFVMFMFGLANLLAATSFFNQTSEHDLERAFNMAKDPQKYLASHRVSTSHISLIGMRPRDYPEEILDILRDNSGYEDYYQMHVFWKSFDSGDLDRAEESIRTAYRMAVENENNSYFAHSAAYEMSMFAARFLNDQTLSREALWLGDKLGQDGPSRGLAIAARLYARGKIDCAIKVGSRATQDFVNSQAGNPEMQQYGREWAKRIIPELT